MLRPDAGPLPAYAVERNRGTGVLALGISLGFHGVALACLVLLREVTPPEPYAVIAVELVQAADVVGSPTEDTDEQALPSQGMGRASAEAAPQVPDEPPLATEDAVAAEETVEAARPIPPVPQRKPLALNSSSDQKSARNRFEEKLAEMKGEPIRPADQESVREVAQSDAGRAAGRIRRIAALEVGRDHAATALPVTMRDNGLAGGLGENPSTLPRYAGGSLSNAPPRYPYLARRRGQEGRVVARVRVSAAGKAAAVTIRRSSGYRLLDEAAVEAVAAWRFVPANRGGIPVAGSVDVPVSFKLTD